MQPAHARTHARTRVLVAQLSLTRNTKGRRLGANSANIYLSDTICKDISLLPNRVMALFYTSL